MVLQKKAEDLGGKLQIIEKTAPLHAFRNEFLHKFSQKNDLEAGKNLVHDLEKGNSIIKLKKKILKKQELTVMEQKFIQRENLQIYQKKNLAEIIISHKNTFPLEKFHKYKEKERIQKSKNELKRSEKMKRMSVQAQFDLEQDVLIYLFCSFFIEFPIFNIY